jgi:hypothetical protein
MRDELLCLYQVLAAFLAVRQVLFDLSQLLRLEPAVDVGRNFEIVHVSISGVSRIHRCLNA